MAARANRHLKAVGLGRAVQMRHIGGGQVAAQAGLDVAANYMTIGQSPARLMEHEQISFPIHSRTRLASRLQWPPGGFIRGCDIALRCSRESAGQSRLAA